MFYLNNPGNESSVLTGKSRVVRGLINLHPQDWKRPMQNDYTGI
jgi:hypothetical protein